MGSCLANLPVALQSVTKGKVWGLKSEISEHIEKTKPKGVERYRTFNVLLVKTTAKKGEVSGERKAKKGEAGGERKVKPVTKAGEGGIRTNEDGEIMKRTSKLIFFF
nr:hypothetical protein Iba_chr14dCG3050 [Ipomoea batatas]